LEKHIVQKKPVRLCIHSFNEIEIPKAFTFTPTSSKTVTDENVNFLDHSFELVAFSFLRGGHYVAIIKQEKEWFNIDGMNLN